MKGNISSDQSRKKQNVFGQEDFKSLLMLELGEKKVQATKRDLLIYFIFLILFLFPSGIVFYVSSKEKLWGSMTEKSIKFPIFSDLPTCTAFNDSL